MIKPSLTEGTKYDGAKIRMDLLPPEFLIGVSAILTFGAAKYDDHNWRLGIEYSRIYGAAQRHLVAWSMGEEIDPESGLPHLWHAACNLSFLISFEEDEKYRSFDNRVKLPKTFKEYASELDSSNNKNR